MHFSYAFSFFLSLSILPRDEGDTKYGPFACGSYGGTSFEYPSPSAKPEAITSFSSAICREGPYTDALTNVIAGNSNSVSNAFGRCPPSSGSNSFVLDNGDCLMKAEVSCSDAGAQGMRFYSRLEREYNAGTMTNDYTISYVGDDYCIVGIQVQSWEILDNIRFKFDRDGGSDGSGPTPWTLIGVLGLIAVVLPIIVYILKIKNIISCPSWQSLMSCLADFQLIDNENEDENEDESEDENEIRISF